MYAECTLFLPRHPCSGLFPFRARPHSCVQTYVAIHRYPGSLKAWPHQQSPMRVLCVHRQCGEESWHHLALRQEQTKDLAGIILSRYEKLG